MASGSLVEALGHFTWIKYEGKAVDNARKCYRPSESQEEAYTFSSTKSGGFNMEHDQVQLLVSECDGM